MRPRLDSPAIEVGGRNIHLPVANRPFSWTCDEMEIQGLLSRGDRAWNAHDPGALADLHHPDAETVNRFGKYVVGDAQHRRRFRFHTELFRGMESPARELVSLRGRARAGRTADAFGWSNSLKMQTANRGRLTLCR